jgi:hypothetical protein
MLSSLALLSRAQPNLTQGKATATARAGSSRDLASFLEKVANVANPTNVANAVLRQVAVPPRRPSLTNREEDRAGFLQLRWRRSILLDKAMGLG